MATLRISLAASKSQSFHLLLVSVRSQVAPNQASPTSRKFYGFERSLFDMDPAFVDLIDTPAVLPVLKWVLTKGQGLPILPGEGPALRTQVRHEHSSQPRG